MSASTTIPAMPYSWALRSVNSPVMAWRGSLPVATTSTSPGCAMAAASFTAAYRSRIVWTVRAGPTSFTGRHRARMLGSMAVSRAWPRVAGATER